ncbi:hypothetical protein JCM8547_003894 [Rhodosporidiobolus lusitaniae]
MAVPPHSRSMPDLTLAADGLSDTGDDLDAFHPPTSPSPPRSPSPPPPRTLAPGTPRPALVEHKLSSEALRLHDQLVRRTSGGRINDNDGQGQVTARDYGVEHVRSPSPASERSYSESIAGSIHSAPEFTAPPSPASLPPTVRFEDGADEISASSRALSSPIDTKRESISVHEDDERAADRGMRRKKGALQRLPSTLWDYLLEEIFSVEVDGEEGMKSERVTNFLTVPKELEKLIIFGVFICLDSFLYTFTILPLRALAALFQLVYNFVWNTLLRPRSARKRHLRLSHKCDLAKIAIFAGTMVLLHRITDASKMYHGVRGQETIKLYVLFNVLEIADRLCCSFGQDLQDSLFSRQTLGRRRDGSHPHIRPLALFALNLAYVLAHSLVLFYQLVTLNVAINSYSNALLTLLLSNQFVEIKGSVFKKFEKENLFQLTCADIVERFQLGFLLFIIAIRNLIELSSASSSSLFSFLPASFRSLSFTFSLPSLPTLSLLQLIFSPAVVVLFSECFVDWLKHAFITKFNHIRPGVYGRFVDVLCKDLVDGKKGTEPFVDQSPSVARRLGLAALPLGCLVVRVISQVFEMLADDSGVDECAPRPAVLGLRQHLQVVVREEDWASWSGRWAAVGLSVGVGLIALKLLIGINLRAFASHRWSTMLEREEEERLNDRQRPQIGVTPREAEQNRQVSALLADDVFDSAYRNRKVNLTTLTRYDMVKSRLW